MDSCWICGNSAERLHLVSLCSSCESVGLPSEVPICNDPACQQKLRECYEKYHVNVSDHRCRVCLQEHGLLSRLHGLKKITRCPLMAAAT